jgi:hypothetical protein
MDRRRRFTARPVAERRQVINVPGNPGPVIPSDVTAAKE